jgi:alkaline phosphatase D
MEQRRIVNSLWITTDVHFAEAFRYRPFPANPAFVVHELASGPLNAGIFPTAAFDTTLNPTVLFGPRPPATVATWEQAKDGFNFGTVEIDGRGQLTAGFVNTAGQRLFSLTLSPQ